MASDTATASTRHAVDDCVGFAEPADILTRLTPDDLHPARLAGPHAWHPWGLTVAPPTDRHLRLVLPPGTGPATRERVLDGLQDRLARTPWPPEGPLEVRRSDSRLDCRDDDGRRSLIEIALTPDREDRGHAEVVTRDGWPILGELAALNDRIRCINVDQPSRTDLADLTSWVEDKMADPPGNHHLVASLPHLLADQARDHPSAADRLRTVLAQREAMAGHPARVLAYLAEQLDHHRVLDNTRRR
jgi:hypothetical protein